MQVKGGNDVRKLLLTLVVSLAAALAAAPTALAADFTLHGGAQAGAGNVKLVSDVGNASNADDFSFIDFSVPAGMKFSELTTLSTQFNVTDDDCGGGSPRFQINFGSQNAFVYLGPSPTFTGCTPNTFVDSGNLVGNNDPCRWDTSQLVPGTQCNTYAGALALLGSRTVTGIQLVVDSGWFFADKEQTVLVCDIRINGSTVFPCEGQAGKPGKGKGREKVVICHNGHTLTVSKQGWVNGHSKHKGDHLGPCTSADKKKAAKAAAKKRKAKGK
jgi:hypothetical protein